MGKSGHKFQEKQTIGISSDPIEIERLCQQGQRWIHNYRGQQDLFVQEEETTLANQEISEVERVLGNIDNILINGTQLILGHIFKNVGFDKINDDVLKQLVITRLCQPTSKSGTVDYLKSYFDEDVNLSKIYRYLDKLYNTQQEKIQQISVEHTRQILGGSIGLVFYDVTTLYFESDYGDELRETGFSKDGKHSQPQVVLGLLFSAGGYPLSYSLFNGSQYEGRTMIPIVEDFVKRFNLNDFVIVTDSGLMNKSNIELLETGGYKYIIGARIKSENKNRLEIWNPGQLPFGLTTEMLKKHHTSLPSNPLLARPMYLYGSIEQVGTGTEMIVEKCIESGLLTPDFEQTEIFKMIFWRKNTAEKDAEVREYTGDKLGDNQKMIIEEIQENTNVSLSELSKIIGISQTAIEKNITKLKQAGLLLRVGKPRSGYWEIHVRNNING